MTDLYTRQAFGVWGPESPIFKTGFATRHLYVVSTGSDFASGDQAHPIRTLEEAARRVALAPGNVDIHLRSDTYVLPASGTFLAQRILSGLVRVFGDQLWDPTVNQVLHAEVAQAGTTGIVITQTGLTPHDFIGLTVEVTTGGVVQRKTIKDNTATDVLPCSIFNPAPAPGDAVRLTRSRAIVIQPSTGAFDGYQLMADQLGVTLYQEAGITRTAFAPSVRQVGLVLENLQLAGTGSYEGLFLTGAGQLYLYGVELPTNALLFSNGTQIFAGVGLARPLDEGWGFGGTGIDAGPLITANQGSLEGNIACRGDGPVMLSGALAILYGGRCMRFASGEQNLRVVGELVSSIPFTVDASLAVEAVALYGPRAFADFSGNCEILGGASGVTAGNGAAVNLGNSVTGDGGAGVSVFATTGGRIYVPQNPVYGGGAGTWKTTNTLAVTRAAFAVGFALVDTVDTSAIIVTV